MPEKLPDTVLKACMEIWLSGGTISEAARTYRVSGTGLTLAISSYACISVKELKEKRIANMGEKKLEKCLPLVKEHGEIRSLGAIRKICNDNPFVLEYLLKRLQELGFEKKGKLGLGLKAIPENSIPVERKKGSRPIFPEKKISGKVLRALAKRKERAKKANLRKLKAQSNYESRLEEALKIARDLNRVPLARELPLILQQNYKLLRRDLLAKGFNNNDINAHADRKYNKEMLLAKMKELAAKLGHTPMGKELYEMVGISATVYAYYFGSLSQAQTEAGLKPNGRGAREMK